VELAEVVAGGEQQPFTLGGLETAVAVAYRQRQLSAAADAAARLAETDRARTALLNTVSHDLRTPIATAKASNIQPARRAGALARR
jgi:K+-sensing histidine kinase KdpD